MIRQILQMIGHSQVTLGELTKKAEDGTITVAEFWLYIDMLTALTRVQKEAGVL